MLSQRIREARTARGMSQVELARRVGISKQSLSNWENGNILPSVEMLTRLAWHLNITTDYLLGVDDRMYIEVTHLNATQIAHIQLIVNDICGIKN